MTQIFCTRGIVLASSLALGIWFTGCAGTEVNSPSDSTESTDAGDGLYN
ncbi:MAG: hypothetical protein F6K03_15465, partial [Kamptonema sp. SIO4C4]|nr:hypothetical protein [Kamptonema sp. SIO4C4]